MQPSDEDGVLWLRPLQGREEESCGLFLPLHERALEQADFPPPNPEQVGDFVGGRLLRDAARLNLRNSTGPFRSLACVSVRPRPYQLVPLIMALRLDPVRLMIADDVGIGKTIEAGLIAKELLERGEARRVCVICPPYLCEQWQRELREKLDIDAVIVRTSTWGQLERRIPAGGPMVYGYYRHIVVSIDFAKGERQQPWFLSALPDLVIVDEAHGAARPPSTSGRSQQQRHELLRKVAEDPSRHLILLTATPHSGVRESFASLLGLLDPSLEQAVRQGIEDSDRERVARHFVQRKRSDIELWAGETTPFPRREPRDVPYEVDGETLALFEDVFAFTREVVWQPGLARHRQRVRYWGALALLRSLMSSAAAAAEALARRAQDPDGPGPDASEEDSSGSDSLDEFRRREVLDVLTEEAALDTVPEGAVVAGSRDLRRRDRERLAAFRERAEALRQSGRDRKFEALLGEVRGLLRDGHHPIVWCRFIATARYVAERLQRSLASEYPAVRVLAVTGEMADEERALRVAELEASPARVLVATDCLSEGIDLQRGFSAVIHYDLPWNPNRLEQREGRVDRYGQSSPVVPALTLYGTNNRIDLAVLEVLIRKAREIRRDLGITVPVPVDSESIVDALIGALFQEGQRRGPAVQLTLPIDITRFQTAWETAARDEDMSRRRFANQSVSLEEVGRVLQMERAIAADPDTLKRFWIESTQRLGLATWADGETLWADPHAFPRLAHLHLNGKSRGAVRVAFAQPAPEDAAVLGRHHPWVGWLADRILGMALAPGGSTLVSRAGAAVTRAVTRRTALLLLRLRYRLLQGEGRPELYAEEVVMTGLRREGGRVVWLDPDGEEMLALAEGAVPESNLSAEESREQVAWALSVVADEGEALHALARQRGERLAEEHSRARAWMGKDQVAAHAYPPDLLGVYVLLPGGETW